MAEERRLMKGRRLDDVWARWDKRVRDSIIFVVGVVGCVHELFIIAEPRPSALVFLASLIGVPFVLSADENKGRRRNGDDGEQTPVQSPDEEPS